MTTPSRISLPTARYRHFAALRSKPLTVALAAAGLACAAPLLPAGADPPIQSDARAPPLALRGSGIDSAPAPDAALATSRVTFRGGELVPVENCNDSGPGSLRAAIAAADDADTIDMRELECEYIEVEDPITIDQPNLRMVGPGASRLAIDGFPRTRRGLFIHSGQGQLYAANLAIVNGNQFISYGNARGGCIRSAGNVFLSRTVVAGCLAHAPAGIATGGAIYAEGKVTLSQSRVSTSQALGDEAMGGGVFARGYLSLRYSTISRNGAYAANADYPSRAGGAFAIGASRVEHSNVSRNRADRNAGLDLLNPSNYVIKILQSTISGNDARELVGGAFLIGYAWVLGSTITDNYAVDSFEGVNSYAAGLQVGYDVDVALGHTIIAGNHGPPGVPVRDFGVFDGTGVNGAHNIVTSVTPFTPVPIDTIAVEPLLGPLRDNGGATLTHALLPGDNVAIDAGSTIQNQDYDQRGFGFSRMLAANHGGTPIQDIGAFEYDPDRIFTSGFDLGP